MLYVDTSKHSWCRWNVGLLLCGYAGLGLLHGHVGRPGERLEIVGRAASSDVEAVAACRLGDGQRLTAVEAIQVGLGFSCQPSSDQFELQQGNLHQRGHQRQQCRLQTRAMNPSSR